MGIKTLCKKHKWGRSAIDGTFICVGCELKACEFCYSSTAASGSCHNCGRQWGACAEQKAEDDPIVMLKFNYLAFCRCYDQMGEHLKIMSDCLVRIQPYDKKND